jgi:hypothetical protein
MSEAQKKIHKNISPNLCTRTKRLAQKVKNSTDFRWGCCAKPLEIIALPCFQFLGFVLIGTLRQLELPKKQKAPSAQFPSGTLLLTNLSLRYETAVPRFSVKCQTGTNESSCDRVCEFKAAHRRRVTLSFPPVLYLPKALRALTSKKVSIILSARNTYTSSAHQ